MRRRAIEVGTNITATSQEKAVNGADDIGRSVRCRIEHACIPAGTAHRFFVVGQLAARRNRNYRHLTSRTLCTSRTYIRGGTATPINSSAVLS